MKILYLQYTNPAAYPPLEHSSHLFSDSGAQVLFLGTEPFGTSAMTFSPYRNIRFRRLPYGQGKLWRKIHYLIFCVWASGWILAWRPQWIYASDPFSCPIGWLASYLPGARVLYHEHDSPGAGGSDRAWSYRLVLRARRALACRAQLCVLPNQERARRFAEEIRPARPPLCVWNCPRLAEVLSAPLETTENRLRLLYLGSLVPARLPVSLLEAMARLPESVLLRVIGYPTIGHPSYSQEFRRAADRLGLGKRLEFIGTLSTREEMFQRARGCDVGIALIPRGSADLNEQAMEGASNKPFDYLVCGLALLVSDLPEWKRVFVREGYGLACDPAGPESIAAALKWFLEYPQERQKMAEAGRQRILEEWNYEEQFKPVYEAILGRRGNSV